MKKAFKDYDSTRFRPFLIILYHLSLMKDTIFLERYQIIIEIFKYATVINAKYFAELDILHQWILKMASVNKKFKEEIEGT